ncbi:MAG TPA: GNAT family N-acetyltransferase [Clostridiaceae bacterium]|nr:GNAT family N-acetyltransferase [Clostridiaceae bacterium]
MNDKIYLKNITDSDFADVLKWYNMTDKFKFATGVDKPITMDTLVKRYIETIACGNEFFLGIYLRNEGIIIGILKGMLENEKGGIAWIKSLVIDPSYQRMGYGSSAVGLFLDFLEKNTKIRDVYLTVVEENTSGINFWRKQQFRELRRIKNCAAFNGGICSILIMHRFIIV